MNNIRKGKLIANVSFLIGLGSFGLTEILNKIYEESVIANLQGTDKMMYDMGVYRVPANPNDGILLAILIGGIIIWILGGFVGALMCRCPVCGAPLMKRHGGIRNYCDNCGTKIDY